MSGGVDSSVSAALLKQAGYEVIGVFIRVWEPAGFVCNWKEERRWARRVAAHLDIPLLTLDLSREYKKRVVDYFISEYKAGRTPNPDVMCNKHIKFGVFYDWAMAHGADFVATGHYSRVEKTRELSMINSQFSQAPVSRGESSSAVPLEALGRSGEPEVSPQEGLVLEIAKDLNKDQSYFLWNLKTEQLSKILFPIGQYTKPEVRKLATKFKLPTALKKDSQGLCFVGKIDFKDFLKREIKEKEGNVLNERGEVIGKHEGATFFTIGERHGFEISTKSPSELPYYIIAKDIKKNTLTVSNKNNQGRALITEIKIEKTNWISDPQKLPTKSYQLKARVRYRQPLQKCSLLIVDGQSSIVTFDQPQIAAPGQSLILYHKDICLGGGIIA